MGKTIIGLAVLIAICGQANAWEIDLSRRQVDFKRVQNQDQRFPASNKTSEEAGLLEQALGAGEPQQDIVIMNTEKGFVPETVFFRKGGNYKVHVVNVNPKQKNVSFVFDAFSEHHNTLFGQVKTFTVTPKADGIFNFQCPETAMQGKAVVAAPDRRPASK